MKSPTVRAPRSHETYSVSELRLNLTHVAQRVKREKIRVVIRRRFDVVAVLISLDDYESANLVDSGGQVFQLKSIREAREGIAGYIDRVLSDGARFVIYQRGEPIAVIVAVSDTATLDPSLHDAIQSRSSSPASLAAATSSAMSVPATASVAGTEIILATERRDQNGRVCVSDGILVLRSRLNRRILSGVIQPTIDITKLMIKVREQFVSTFVPVTNKDGFYDLGEVEVELDVTSDDVEFVRLA